jgi:uncharacterized protein YhaN
MIIKDLHIDGFGVWSDLELDGLDAGLTLLYGENETGKTTLLEFVRSVLYGFNDDRRNKYLPPVRGGLGGGTLGVETHAGRFRVRRRAEGDSAVGRLDVTSYTGTAQDVRQLKKILADLDESTFKNVFALGLGEIQELGTLSGGGAAEYLYDLAVGSGGVSLTEVQRELEKSRNGLLSSERNSQVGQLLDRRTKLLAEIEQLRQIGRSYALLADERERLADDVQRCEIEAEEIRTTAGLHEAAIGVYERWHLRADVAAKLESIGVLAPIPDDAFPKLTQLRDRYRELQPTLEKLRKERSDVRKQIVNLPLNRILWQQGPRIEVLAAQIGWIETLETEIRKLEAEAPPPAAPARRETLSGELVKLGLTPSSAEKLSDRRVLKNLYRYHRERREADKRLEQATQDEARGRELMEHAAAVESKANAGVRRETNSFEQQGQLVANLRKRIQVDQKIEQLSGHRDEAQRRLRDLLAVNKVPADMIFNLNTAFVIGCLLFFTGIVVKGDVLGLFPNWLLVILGAFMALLAGGSKVMRDLATNEQLDTLRNQSRSLEVQLHELENERNELDTLLPAGAGPMLTRLQAAERELAGMEEHAVGETRRVAVRDDMESVRVEYRTAQELADKAARRWQQELERAGLPAAITWEQLRGAARSRGKQDLEKRKIERRVKYLERRRGELAMIADRTAQAFTEAQLEPQGERVSEQLRYLHAEWRRNEDQLEHRKALRSEHRAVDRRLAAAKKELHTLARRRKHLLRTLGAPSEKHLLRRRDRIRERAQLHEQHEALSREIAMALGQRGSEEDLRSRLENFELPQLEQRWTELCDRLTAIEKRLKELYAEQGRLAERLAATAADTSLPRKLYDLKLVERSIGDALARWETLTVTQRLVEAVRKKYETERQPETLREASRYFERLTEGKYRRVWTPLEAGILFVDTKDGEKLSVDLLSRGTREQLFLALRLALVDLYAKRGKTMPLVLDDVLVNFDTRRTRIAAELLCDFATDHRQLLLFTCHEHIYHLFKTLRAELRLLPGQTINEAETSVRIVEKFVDVPRIVEKIVEVPKVVEKIVEKFVEVPRTVEVEKVVERIVKQPVYINTPAPEPEPLPPLPWLDGLDVFHKRPPATRKAPPPPKEPEYEDVVEEEVVEAPPQTIVHTKRVGYPVVPLWSPATPFAEAAWQESIEDVDQDVGRNLGSVLQTNGSNGGGAGNGSNGNHGRRERTPPPRAARSPFSWAEDDVEDDDSAETD